MPVQYEKQRVTFDADEPISITVDASDLTGASAEPLKNIMSRYGRPVVARAFADFQQTNLSELAVQLYQMGFTLVHCPTWPNGDGFPKSVVSDIMAQDLRDQLEELEGVETFLVAATSREYIAVANALRRHDRRVVIVAEEAKVARELRLCADEFAILPPTKAERPAPAPRATRTTTRATEAHRLERVPEIAKVERATELVKIEPPRVERAPEPVRPERIPEPAARAESQDQLRLPSDGEVLTEVRKIITAEGICTPRRLARALCPVDRTPTGELRSRIANRIQSLVDSGKLVRDRLVVGGTSVETIVVGDERGARAAQTGAAERPLAESPAEQPSAQPVEPEPTVIEPMGGDGVMQSEVLPAEPIRGFTPEPKSERIVSWGGRDLDAIVESVLRGPDTSASVPKVEAEVAAEPQPDPVAVPADTEAPEPEAPKRPRSRRRTSTKKTAPEPEAAT